MKSFARNRAFTLVELSIVLVILGLLVGGVIAGQSLISAAQLRSINVDATKYMTAINSFEAKYKALPGDMPTATRYWGAASPSACATTIGTGTQTCDGDGDGSILTQSRSDESLRVWQHLANAGLIPGRYDGVTYNKANQPNAAFGKNTIWRIAATGLGNALILSEITSDYAYLTAEDAYDIDSKYDDGLPETGKIRAFVGSGIDPDLGCYQNGKYTVSVQPPECGITYYIDL